ncbi:hypothetical protein LOK49_LG07G02985 [Camellia lanceoleosa]|uniref:Uncharacterized protein n=1 Tax=Camellia lanceoleosa TaxID=1840588 RepID=A0ACC0H0J3_9ERIC|nr:hypothetical protein LOK49_LG07G02985 [Camellia lanceoleosa]
MSTNINKNKISRADYPTCLVIPTKIENLQRNQNTCKVI